MTADPAIVPNRGIQDPRNEFATPESFAEAMNAGEWIGVNLDLGHFWAANFDPVDYLKKNHTKVVTVHLKDRKKNQGANMAFGEGDTPLKECLHLIRDSKWKILAMIDPYLRIPGEADHESEPMAITVPK